ncbi:hypothetical protein P171DRAFT_505528, partial [Karstenula rhodostoma CBS 690.94]
WRTRGTAATGQHLRSTSRLLFVSVAAACRGKGLMMTSSWSERWRGQRLPVGRFSGREPCSAPTARQRPPRGSKARQGRRQRPAQGPRRSFPPQASRSPCNSRRPLHYGGVAVGFLNAGRELDLRSWNAGTLARWNAGQILSH